MRDHNEENKREMQVNAFTWKNLGKNNKIVG